MTSRKSKKRESPLYTLQTFKEGQILGVCTSMEKMKEAVNYWMNERPLTTLSILEWKPNYTLEPIGWEWAYISPTADCDELEDGGGWVPPKELWGENLVEIDLQPHYNKWHDEQMKGLYKDEVHQTP